MNRRAIAVIATGLVVAMVVLGLFVTGSPGKARRLESDRTRVDRLAQLHYQLESHFNRTGELPESLAELERVGWERPGSAEKLDLGHDPVTGEPFEYKKLGEAKYEICAEFAEDSEIRGAMPYDTLTFQDHKAGRQCFTQTVRKHPEDAIPHPPLRTYG